MSQYRTDSLSSRPAGGLPWPLPAAALAGVRTRRIIAVLFDSIFIGILAFFVWLLMGIATLGLTLFLVPVPIMIVAFFYNGLTVSGRKMGTPGMRMMDLEVRLTDGAPVPFINAAAHAVMYWLSWFFPLVFLVSLLSDDKRCLHDMLANMIVLRRAD